MDKKITLLVFSLLFIILMFLNVKWYMESRSYTDDFDCKIYAPLLDSMMSRAIKLYLTDDSLSQKLIPAYSDFACVDQFQLMSKEITERQDIQMAYVNFSFDEKTLYIASNAKLFYDNRDRYFGRVCDKIPEESDCELDRYTYVFGSTDKMTVISIAHVRKGLIIRVRLFLK